MQTNPFPAILLAGSPHSGKSVLSFLLTKHLRNMHSPHFLLRAVPNGEDDWYVQSDDQALVRTLRSEHRRFSAKFVAQVRRVIEQRQVPLLVDIGEPQGDPFGIIEMCSHSILLYHDPADHAEWQGHLAQFGLLPVAELQSQQALDDQILESRPVLMGIISGLERDSGQRKAGATFGALLDRVAGICHFTEPEMERLHLIRAPYPPLIERELARHLGISGENGVSWQPAALPVLQGWLAADQAAALYGCGPTWLAAMLAAQTQPAPMSIFDVCFGWVDVPQVSHAPHGNLSVTYSPIETGGLADIQLSKESVLETSKLTIATPHATDGITISGNLPRWIFAALARFFAKTQPWVAIHDPNFNRAIVVFSRSASVPIGMVLSL